MKKGCAQILLWLICLFIQHPLYAQTCVSDYFNITYETSTVQDPVGCIFTSQQEILLAGTVLRRRSIASDGWITKLSAQGSVIWSKNYSSPDYNCIKFNKAVPANDGGYMIAGNIGNIDITKAPPPVLTRLGFLLKVDKYGNIIWSRLFGKTFVAEKLVDINDIIRTKDGDFIISVNYSAAVNSCNIVLRLDQDGNIKWTSTLTSADPPASYGYMHLQQLRNGDIAVANRINIFDINNPHTITKQGYYFATIDYDSGLPEWQRAFYSTSFSGREKAYGDVAQITELPNGDLSLITSFADTAYIYFRKTTRVLNFITDNIGRLQKILSYRNPQPPFFASAGAAVGNNGDQVIVMDNADIPSVMCIDATGQLKWQKAFTVGRSQESRLILSTEFGFYFFSFTHNGGSTDLHLVKTDITGNSGCTEAAIDIITEDVSSSYKQEFINLTLDTRPATWYNIIALSVADYSMKPDITCKQTCCTDVIDSSNKVDLCNTTSYSLPDNYVVKNSGTYDIKYKSFKGCDSIVRYHINFSKDPEVNLGYDDCLEGKDSVILKTKAGYESYNWMGTSSDSYLYTVKQPGKYWVSVTNGCGTKKDTIEVFKKCDFTIYMPNAFSPNGDIHNEYFRIPEINKNKLVSFVIFNRWGQAVFRTVDRNKSWDGTLNNKPQPAGMYVYYLEMETLSGKKVTQKGIVTLTR